jgi:3-oxoacyl-(acyl-carrier-protein) synthase
MEWKSPHACITGLGFVTSIGNGEADVLESLKNLNSGIRPHRFFGDADRSDVKVAGVIDGFDFSAASWAGWTYPDRYAIPKELLRGLAPHGVYAYCAIEQALEEAGISKDQLSGPRIGLHCASAGSPMLMHRYLGQLHGTKGRRGAPLGVVSTISGTLNFNLAAHYGIKGANLGFVSACASSSHAIGYALDEIRLGRQDAVLVVGAEDFTAESLMPFGAMNALSRQSGTDASCPWDTRRDGFVATGGASALLLESPAFARNRGATVLAKVTGWGQSSDGSDRTSSHPEGEGLRRAIGNALQDAGTQPAEIDYINAHATSTKVGDVSEAKAINEVFHQQGHHPPTSSTKGLTGHGLSMAGAMEAAFCTLFLRDGFHAGNAHLDEVDPECRHLNLPTHSSNGKLDTILSNSSGFGGSNVSLVIEKA